MVTEPKSVARYLRSLGEPTEAPPRTPARGPPYRVTSSDDRPPAITPQSNERTHRSTAPLRPPTHASLASRFQFYGPSWLRDHEHTRVTRPPCSVQLTNVAAPQMELARRHAHVGLATHVDGSGWQT